MSKGHFLNLNLLNCDRTGNLRHLKVLRNEYQHTKETEYEELIRENAYHPI